MKTRWLERYGETDTPLDYQRREEPRWKRLLRLFFRPINHW